MNGRIQDLNSTTTAAEREAFGSTVFTTPTGSTETGTLRWGDAVEILERHDRRTRVRAGSGLEGWVQKGDVVQLGWVKRRGRGKRAYTAKLYRRETGNDAIYELLWGDPVLIMTPGEHRHRVRARGWTGWLDKRDIGSESLLEIYFIDVGQGDGVLVRTPDGRHLLVDGGYNRGKQPSGKSAADFVDWKFFQDYGLARVHLDAMIASHCDADHYGGLRDLLSTDAVDAAEMDTAATDIGAFYHAGVSWWRPGQRWLGRTRDGFHIDLLGDHDHLTRVLRPDAPRRLQGEWAAFLRLVQQATRDVRRLGVPASDPGDVFLPGFAPGDGTGLTIRVLAPVVHDVNGRPAVKDLGADSQNTNGHSIMLRIDFGQTRILLTGDLNKKSMHALLEEYRGREDVLGCDVAKGCHHGSDDVSYSFLGHVRAAATVISSGDNEGHAHPRPTIVAASALTGHVTIDEEADELVTPVVYATEVERSIDIGRCTWLESSGYPHGGGAIDLRLYAAGARHLPEDMREDAEAKKGVRSRLYYEETRAGALAPEKRSRSLAGAYVVSGIIYGLVNVRTDGETIMCATMNEAEKGWNVQVFEGRF